MDPSALVPVPDPIPVHWSWLKLFLLSTFFLHLLCMNTMVGMGIIALIRSLFNRSKDVEYNREIIKKVNSAKQDRRLPSSNSWLIW